MRRRLVWIQGGAGNIAVLYSILNGNTREFWVKTSKFNLKIGEFSETTTLTPTISWGNEIGSSISNSGSLSASPNENASTFISGGSIICPVGTLVSLSITTTAQLISGGQTRIGVVRSSMSNIPSSLVSAFVPTDSESGSSGVIGPNISTPTAKARTALIGAVLSSGRNNAGFPSSISFSGTVTHTVSNIISHTRTTPYEAWLSSNKDEIFVTIKYLEETLLEGDTATENDTFDRVRVVRINNTGTVISNTLYSSGDAIPANADNWRDVLNNFADAGNQAPSGDACIESYKLSSNSNLFEGMLYTVNGDTLATRSAVSGETCLLGNVSESEVKTPTVDVGTVEGISFHPL